MGKATALLKVMRDESLGKCADVFTNITSTKAEVVDAGDLTMRLLTGGTESESLAVHRFKEYKRRVLKGNTAVSPEFLPPTSGATEQHSLRVRHQIMSWSGVELPAEEYGWYIANNTCRAKFTNHKAAPQELLKAIFCNCKTECDTKRCTCKRYNLPCTDLCGKCQGTKCANIAQDG